VTLKAYSVFPGEVPADQGSILVFAETTGKAKHIGCKAWPGIGLFFFDFNVWRIPKYDHYAVKHGKPAAFDCNSDLPDWIDPFFDNCLVCSEIGIGEYPAYPGV
jgi:hypothetical protein